MPDAAALIADLAKRGIKPTFYDRPHGTIFVWRPYWLTPEDRRALREVWPEVNRLVLLARNTGQAPSVAPPQAGCAYCGNRPCVGPGSDLYPTLHANDPKEIARRDREATAAMMRTEHGYTPGWK